MKTYNHRRSRWCFPDLGWQESSALVHQPAVRRIDQQTVLLDEVYTQDGELYLRFQKFPGILVSMELQGELFLAPTLDELTGRAV